MNKLTDTQEKKFLKSLENREKLKEMLDTLKGQEYVESVKKIIEDNKDDKKLLKTLVQNVDDAFMEERISFSDRYDLVCDKLYSMI